MAFYIIYSVELGSRDIYSGKGKIDAISNARPLLNYWYQDYSNEELLEAIENEDVPEIMLIRIDKHYPKVTPDTDQLISIFQEWENDRNS